MLPLLPFNVPVVPVPPPTVIFPVAESVPVLTFKVPVVPDDPIITAPFTVRVKLDRLNVPVETVKAPQDTLVVKVGLFAALGIVTGSFEAGTVAGLQLLALLQFVGPPASPPTQVCAV
jgi:hypothetical protein